MGIVYCLVSEGAARVLSTHIVHLLALRSTVMSIVPSSETKFFSVYLLQG